MPYLKPYVLASTVIANYTDYNGSYDPDEVMELIETTDFYRILTKSINKAQYIQFEDAVEECIAYRNAHSETEAFFHDLRTMLSDWAQSPEKLQNFLQNQAAGTAEPEKQGAAS